MKKLWDGTGNLVSKLVHLKICSSMHQIDCNDPFMAYGRTSLSGKLIWENQ